MSKDSKSIGGIHLKRLIFILVATSVLISALLRFITLHTQSAYNDLHNATGDYINWQLSASDMIIASDYMTEQVRCFAETGDDEYLNNYFTELKDTRRRDKALDALRDDFEGTSIYSYLEDAMHLSETLTDREFFSMKLRVLSMGKNIEDYPEEVSQYKLTERIQSLSQNRLAEMSRSIVFDSMYRNLKNSISLNVQRCTDEIEAEINRRQNESLEKLHNLIFFERVLIIILIIALFVMVVIIIQAVIRPIIKAVPHINNGEKIPEVGSYEFRFLAKTYNDMFETNSRQRGELEHAASHDHLTGVYNRSGFDTYLRTLDFDTTTLIIIDIDNFKDINDTYGHAIGDKVLRRVADTIRTHFRADDIICRIGGDEFVVFMKYTGLEKKDTIERKISEINECLGVAIDDMPAISLSVGAAYGRGLEPEDVYKKADRALYETKENGRHGFTYYE